MSTVHVKYMDGREDSATGYPLVEGEALVVRVDVGQNPTVTVSEVGFPLRHVRTWWWQADTDELPTWAQGQDQSAAEDFMASRGWRREGYGESVLGER